MGMVCEGVCGCGVRSFRGIDVQDERQTEEGMLGREEQVQVGKTDW